MAQEPKSFGRRQTGQVKTADSPRPKGAAPANAGKIVALIAAPLVVLIAVGAYFAYSFLMASRGELDASIEPMLTTMAASGWRDDSIEGHASPALKDWFQDRNATGVMRDLNRLGPIVRYEGVKEFNVSKQNGGGSAQAIT